jgi:hypothetical protein
VPLAPLVGLVATMVLAATERTADILPIRISRMREEANSTMAAVDRTACQTGMIAQDGIQRELILTNKPMGAVVLMPIRAKREEFPDGYDKNARFSVRMLIPLFMSPSYSLNANASSGRAGIFCGSGQHFDDLAEQRIHPPKAISPYTLAQLAPIRHAPQTGYRERKTNGYQSGIEDQPYYSPSK